jgi:sugar (pentulose or hexulose) kinase
MLRASFWPAKLCWLRRTESRIFRRVIRWVSPGEWIFRELFGADGCSHSMASATGLYHLRENKWDPDLREFCSVREDQLSPISDFAQQNRQSSIDLRNAKIFAAIGDGAASNLGCGANVTGQIAINVGTSAAVRMIQPHHQGGRSHLPFGLFVMSLMKSARSLVERLATREIFELGVCANSGFMTMRGKPIICFPAPPPRLTRSWCFHFGSTSERRVGRRDCEERSSALRKRRTRRIFCGP